LHLELKENPVPLGWSAEGSFAAVVPPGEVYPEDMFMPGDVYLSKPGQMPTRLLSLFEGEDREKDWEAFHRSPQRIWRSRREPLLAALARSRIDCGRLGTRTDPSRYWLWPQTEGFVVSTTEDGRHHRPLAVITFPKETDEENQSVGPYRHGQPSEARLSPDGTFVALEAGGWAKIVVPTSPDLGLTPFCQRSSVASLPSGLGLAVNTSVRAGPSTDAPVLGMLPQGKIFREDDLISFGAISCQSQAIVVQGAAAEGRWMGIDREGWIYGPTLIQDDQPEIVAATADPAMKRVAFATRGGRIGVSTISRKATERRLLASRPRDLRMLGALPALPATKSPIQLEMDRRGDRLLASNGRSLLVWDLSSGELLLRAFPFSSKTFVARLSPSGEWALMLVREEEGYSATVFGVSPPHADEVWHLLGSRGRATWAASSASTLPLAASFLDLGIGSKDRAEGVVFVDGEGQLRRWDARKPAAPAIIVEKGPGDLQGVIVGGANELHLLRGDPEKKTWSIQQRSLAPGSPELSMAYHGKIRRLVTTAPGSVSIQAAEDGTITELDLTKQTSADQSWLVYAMGHGPGTDFNGRRRVVTPWMKRRLAIVDTEDERTLAVVSLDEEIAGEAEAHCENGSQDGDESDIDCGGAACTPCAPAAHCKTITDCATGTLCLKEQCLPLSRLKGQICYPEGECAGSLDDQGDLYAFSRLGVRRAAKLFGIERPSDRDARSSSEQESTPFYVGQAWSLSVAAGPGQNLFAAFLEGKVTNHFKTSTSVGQVRFAQRKESGWSLETVATIDENIFGSRVDLVADHEGKPHLFMTLKDESPRFLGWGGERQSETYWLRKKGRRWKKELVTKLEASDTEVVSRIAAAIDHQGRPHLVYALDNRSESQPILALVYAVWGGSTWKTNTLLRGEKMAWLWSGYVRAAADLVLDEAGSPHVVYFDGNTGKLIYARQENGAWVRETIDVAHPPTFHSLALNLDDPERPKVLFVDELDSQLVVAERADGKWMRQPLALPIVENMDWIDRFHGLGWAQGQPFVLIGQEVYGVVPTPR